MIGHTCLILMLQNAVKTNNRILFYKCNEAMADHFVRGPATRKPTDWYLSLANEENKLQLCQLHIQVWGSKSAASRLERSRTAVAVVEGNAYQLDSTDGDVSIQYNSIFHSTDKLTLQIMNV